MEIIDVITIYTAGEMYEYVVQLDGCWTMFSDNDLGREYLPLVDQEPSDGAWCPDFLDRHCIGSLEGDEANTMMLDVLAESMLYPHEVAERRAWMEQRLNK